MNWRVVARGRSPSGEAVVHLCSRTGRPASEVRDGLLSATGLVILESLSREAADNLAASLSFHGLTIEVVPCTQDPGALGFRVVLTGYAPGNRGRLRAALMRMSRRSDEEVIGFLSRIPFALRRNADAETAASVRRFIEAAGGVVEIRPEASAASVPKPAPEPTPAREEDPVPPRGRTPKPGQPVFSPDPPEAPEAPPLPDSKAVPVIREPHSFTALPPDPGAPWPEVLLPRKDTDFPEPYRVDFNSPVRLAPLPPRIGRHGCSGPPVTGAPHPVFLCPVQEDLAPRAVLLLQSYLGMRGETAERAVRSAPSVVSLESGPGQAAERVRELTALGLPVTLVKEQKGPVDHKDHVWFRHWLRAR